MTLKHFIDTLANPIFLIDSSGVLYSNNGFLRNAAKTFQYLQSKGPTFLASNNSYHYVNDIANQLYYDGNITLNTNHIISSGHGLSKDPKISKLIAHKIIYFIGPKSAKHYALDAHIKGITNQIENAEAIILAGLNENQSSSIINNIINIVKQKPSLPIICCNKDQYIRTQKGLQPVVGYFAKKIETTLNKPIHWFGKPLKNFSSLVTNHLKTLNLSPNKLTIFFDDNIENVVSMQKHLGISGCWIRETGILYNQNSDDLIKKYGNPTYSLPSFELEKPLITY